MNEQEQTRIAHGYQEGVTLYILMGDGPADQYRDYLWGYSKVVEQYGTGPHAVAIVGVWGVDDGDARYHARMQLGRIASGLGVRGEPIAYSTIDEARDVARQYYTERA